MFRLTPTNIGWLLAYFAMLAAIYFGMANYRATAMASYGTSAANEDWQEWRSAAKDLGEEGPVSRRPPKAKEPPALLLMRDHFPACLGISLLLSSCLFGWFMICARGVLRPVVLHDDD